MNLNVDQKYIQFGLYRLLIIHLGVLLGFYTFNVRKYNFGNLTTSPVISGPDPRLGTTGLEESEAPKRSI